MAKKYLIVTAGGTGTRMGADRPKQFLEIGGKAILQLTIERFLAAVPDISVIVTLPGEHIQTWKQYCYDHAFSCRQTLVEGGFTRFHSIKNGLEKVPDGAIVAVHDGVRPLVSPEMIARLFREAETRGSAVPVLPCVETLRVLDPKAMAATGETLDRSRVFSVQTPQMFRSETLKAAYRQPFNTSFTDDSSVVEADGGQVFYTEGERFNIKITTPDDLVLASALLGR